ncbi:Phosphorylated carbohydrates phosphatase [Hordeum vulgare]|nr:Phosphorylated carbohydrates phosphatase [Hordeum vulgare]
MSVPPVSTAETDVPRLRRKNANALRLAIEQLELVAKEAAAEAAQIAKLKRERERVVHRMKGLIVLFDSDDGDSGTSSSDDQDPPPAADGYSCAND